MKMKHSLIFSPWDEMLKFIKEKKKKNVKKEHKEKRFENKFAILRMRQQPMSRSMQLHYIPVTAFS